MKRNPHFKDTKLPKKLLFIIPPFCSLQSPRHGEDLSDGEPGSPAELSVRDSTPEVAEMSHERRREESGRDSGRDSGHDAGSGEADSEGGGDRDRDRDRGGGGGGGVRVKVSRLGIKKRCYKKQSVFS